jgi:DHA1 family bicyclomycin/chloramphenicol resistance-like MFS transporter
LSASSAPRRDTDPGWPFVLSLASLGFVGPLAVHLFMPVMPEVKRAFDISSATTGLTFSVTLFVMAVATLVYGALSDRYGRRPVLMGGLLLFLAGTAVSALAGTVAGFVVGRILQAAGAGCGATLNRAIAHDAYGPERAVKVFAYLTMAYTLAPMVSPFVGGLLIDGFGWRSVFWFALAVGVVISLAAWRVLHETRPRAAGARRAGPGMIASYRTLLARPLFVALVLQSGFSTATFMSLATGASFLMQDYLGRSAAGFGAWFMLFPGGFLVGSGIASRLAGRVPIPRMILAGSVLMWVATWTQSALLLAGVVTPLVLFVPGMLLTFAQGLALPNAQSGAMRIVPALAGAAAGAGVFSQMFLGAAGAQAYAFVADGTPRPLAITLAVFAGCTLLAGIAQNRMQRARPAS